MRDLLLGTYHQKHNTCFIMDIEMKCGLAVWIGMPESDIHCLLLFLSDAESHFCRWYIHIPPNPCPSSPLLNVQNVVFCQSAVSEPCHCITELHFIYQIICILSSKKIWQNDCIIAHGLIFFLQQYKKCLSLNCGSNRYMYICNDSSTAKTGSFQS